METVRVPDYLGAAWRGSLRPAAEKSVNETVTQAELFPYASPVTQASLPLQTDTRAQRRAGSGAAEGAGARAAAAQPGPARPSPTAASHPAALHLCGAGEGKARERARRAEARREQPPKESAAEAESPF